MQSFKRLALRVTEISRKNFKWGQEIAPQPPPTAHGLILLEWISRGNYEDFDIILIRSGALDNLFALRRAAHLLRRVRTKTPIGTHCLFDRNKMIGIVGPKRV